MNAPLHRKTDAFLSRACGTKKHWACTKSNCTCHCHVAVEEFLDLALSKIERQKQEPLQFRGVESPSKNPR